MDKYAVLNTKNLITQIIEAEGIETELEAVFTQHFGWTVKRIPPATIASIGDFYHSEGNVFIKPQPYDSWVLNNNTYTWEPPVEYPELDNPDYLWNELKKDWVHLANNFLDTIYLNAQYKGMPFVHSDNKTYHIQTRDVDKTNIIGLFLSAQFFQTSGDLVYITVYENTTLGIERDTWLGLVPQYMMYVSAQHHAKQAVLTQLKIDKTINAQASFETELDAILNP